VVFMPQPEHIFAENRSMTDIVVDLSGGRCMPPPIEAPPLLLMYHAAVQSRKAALPLAGCLCVGVGNASRMVWWQADFAPSPASSFVTRPSDNASCVVRLGTQTAAVIVSQGTLGGVETACYSGNLQLFEDFFNRYVRVYSVFGLRAEANVIHAGQ